MAVRLRNNKNSTLSMILVWLRIHVKRILIIKSWSGEIINLNVSN
jgi:hypothetical protein